MRRSQPQYRLHKPSGQAVVTLNGEDFYLGEHGSQKSEAEYDRLIAEWLANGRRAPSRSKDLTVNELLVAFLNHAATYYRKPDGTPGREINNIKLSIRPLRELYAHTLARDFSPLALKAVRQKMVASGLCRNQCNKRTGRVIHVFRWAVENELVPANVHHGLKAVSGLRRGRSEARETEPVRPVPEAFVEAVQSHVLPQVWAMIQLQRFTGMRPGEVVRLRTSDLDMTGRVLIYQPPAHKTAHHGHERVICIGPKAQAVLRPWLKTDLQAPLFSPREALEGWRARLRAARKTRVQPSQRNRRKHKLKRTPQETYSVEAYGRAIARACKKAKIPHWHPHQLRHNAATWLRKEFGLDAARCILGHRSTAVTEVYAEVDRQKAIEIMGLVG